MKKIISILLIICLMASFFIYSSAEELKDTNVLGEIEFMDPEKIHLSQDEEAYTVSFPEIQWIKAGNGFEETAEDESAQALYDFLKAPFTTEKEYIKYKFNEKTSVSGIRLYDDNLCVENGTIYGSENGTDFFEIGKVNTNGGSVSVTDFGFNMELSHIAIALESEDALSIAELHIIRGKNDYSTITEGGLSDALYYKNEKSKWTITADTEYRLSPATKMFDGDKSTFWHSDYTEEGEVKPKKELPHTVTVNFNEDKVISGIRYTSRNGNSRITIADIYLSEDGYGFYRAGRGKWSYGNNDDKVIDFGENIKVRAIKFVSRATEGNQYSTGAELEFKKPDMAYNESPSASEVTKAYVDGFTASTEGNDGIENAIDSNESTYWESEKGDSIKLAFGETIPVSGIRITTLDDEEITKAKIYVTYDGTKYIDFAEHELLSGEYLFRANLNVKGMKIDISEQSASTVKIAEIAPVSECAYYKEIALNKEIRDTDKFSSKATSQNELQPAANMIDGDIHTIWHSYYNNAKGEKDMPPIDLVVDFGEIREISGFNYYPTRSNKNADSAGFFKKLKVFIAFEEGDDVLWYPLMNDSYSYGSYYAVQTTSFDYNYKVRQVKITVTEGNYDYVTGAEIRFLKGDDSKKPKSAEALNEFGTFEFDEFEDVTIPYKLNDAEVLTGVYYDGSILSENYYSATEDELVLSKYFFSDYLENEEAADVRITLAFFRGENITYTIKVGGAERHKVSWSNPENGSITVKAGEDAVTSGDEVKRSSKLKVRAEADTGYELELISIETTEVVYEKGQVSKDSYVVTASNEFPTSPASNMNDGNVNTYWHSYYEVVNSSPVNAAKPPYDIIITFADKQDDIGGIAYIPRKSNDGGRIIRYKVYVSYDGENYEVLPVASGNLNNSADEQEMSFDRITDGVKAIKLTAETTSGGTYCHVAEVSVFTMTEKKVTGKETYKGTKITEYEIDDLYADITLSVRFKEIEAGKAKVSYGLTKVEIADAVTETEKGKDLTLNLKTVEGYWLPDEISVLLGGTALDPELDYTYTKADNENGILTLKNVTGDVEITIKAIDHDTYPVTYKDGLGATGTLPETVYVRAGKYYTVEKSNLKLPGYKFAGWSYNGETYKAGSRIMMPASGIVFNSVWEKDTSIKDDETKRPSFGGGGGGGGGGGAAGGSATPPGKLSVYIVGTGYITVNAGQIIDDPKNIPGFTFEGWFLDEGFSVPYNNTGVTESLILYPCYKKARSAGDFSDIENHWAKDAINDMYLKGFVSGKGENIFDPDADITRAEFCQILFMMSGGVSEGEEGFGDVSEGDWYRKAVIWAVNNGITQGTGEDTFAPNEKITREQMAVMIYRYATKLGVDWTVSKEAGFADNGEFSEYAIYQINWACDKGIIKGYPDNTFKAKNSATRAEAITMLQRILSI